MIREPSLFISWNGERLDVLARGLLSRVMGVASQSHTALPLFDLSLECEAVLPMNSQSAPPSARVADVDDFSRVSDEPVGHMSGRVVSVTEEVVFLDDMDVHPLGDGSRIRISLAAHDGMVSWQERLVHARELSCLLAPLCSSAGRRFRKLVRIHKQSPDIAGGVHVGKVDLDVGIGDQGILFRYAGDETGKTKVSSLMIGLGEVVTTIRTSGFGMDTVECKTLSFTVWGVGGQD